MSTLHALPTEYCGQRENTIHHPTTDKVFRCCGERVPVYLREPAPAPAPLPATTSTSSSKPPTRNNNQQLKKQKRQSNAPETIIISSPIMSPTKSTFVKTGQFTHRQIVELYRKGSITRSSAEKKLKNSSTYGISAAISAPVKNVKQPILARDSRKIVVYVGSTSDKWPAFKNLGVSSKVFDDFEEIIFDVSDFAQSLLESSPNWIDAEAVNVDYLDIQQIIPATFFSAKEGPHRLEVRKKPITVGEFLLDFPGGAATKIYLIVKYWTAKDREQNHQQQRDVSQAFMRKVKRETRLDYVSDSDTEIKEEPGTRYRMLSVGHEKPQPMKRTASGRHIFEEEDEEDSQSPPATKRHRMASPDLPVLPVLEYSSPLRSESPVLPPIPSSPPNVQRVQAKRIKGKTLETQTEKGGSGEEPEAEEAEEVEKAPARITRLRVRKKTG